MQQADREAFVAGDPAALGRLYRDLAGPVWTVAMSILHDRGLAAEASQQTFLQAWRARASFDPSRQAAPWVYAIARHVSIDILRRESRQPNVVRLEAEGLPVTEPGLDHAWQAFEVRRALGALSEEEREVIRLTHYEGFTHREVADRLGIAIGTVKSRSHRAHRRLLAELAHLLDVEPNSENSRNE